MKLQCLWSLQTKLDLKLKGCVNVWSLFRLLRHSFSLHFILFASLSLFVSSLFCEVHNVNCDFARRRIKKKVWTTALLDDKISYIHESIIFLVCVYVQFCMSYNKVKFARQKIFIWWNIIFAPCFVRKICSWRSLMREGMRGRRKIVRKKLPVIYLGTFSKKFRQDFLEKTCIVCNESVSQKYLFFLVFFWVFFFRNFFFLVIVQMKIRSLEEIFFWGRVMNFFFSVSFFSLQC